MSIRTGSKSWGSGRVAFLSRLEAIRARVEAGEPLRTIHRDHADSIGVSYQQFCVYASRYIGRAHQQEGREVGPGLAATAPAANATSRAVQRQPGYPAGVASERAIAGDGLGACEGGLAGSVAGQRGEARASRESGVGVGPRRVDTAIQKPGDGFQKSLDGDAVADITKKFDRYC